jgi:hypothetical protein
MAESIKLRIKIAKEYKSALRDIPTSCHQEILQIMRNKKMPAVNGNRKSLMPLSLFPKKKTNRSEEPNANRKLYKLQYRTRIAAKQKIMKNIFKPESNVLFLMKEIIAIERGSKVIKE